MRAYLLKLLLNLQMVMHEPWKASAPEVYLLRTTDGSVPRGLDPNSVVPDKRGHEGEVGWLVGGERLEVELGLELGDGDGLGAEVEAQRHDGVHRVDVEERQHRDRHLLPVLGGSLDHLYVGVQDLHHIGHQVVVCQGNALWETRRSGGVWHDTDL